MYFASFQPQINQLVPTTKQFQVGIDVFVARLANIFEVIELEVIAFRGLERNDKNDVKSGVIFIVSVLLLLSVYE